MDSALSDLRLLELRMRSMSLFSPNEAFDELATRDIPYMLVFYLAGDLELSARTTETFERIDRIRRVTVSTNMLPLSLSVTSDLL